MIAFCGFPGTGKTLHMTKTLYRAYKKGHLIITNYNVEFAHIVAKDFQEMIRLLENLYSLVVDYGRPLLKTRKIFIGIDETSVVLNSRNFKRFPDILLNFIPQTRKVGVHIFYTTQSPYYTDVNLRRLTDYWEWFEKLSDFWNWGWSHRYVLNPENPDRTMLGGGNEKLTRLPRLYHTAFNAGIFRKYDTYEIVRSDSKMPEQDTELQKRILDAVALIEPPQIEDSPPPALSPFSVRKISP